MFAWFPSSTWEPQSCQLQLAETGQGNGKQVLPFLGVSKPELGHQTNKQSVGTMVALPGARRRRYAVLWP